MRQSNGTIVVYTVHDLFRGQLYAVALKGVNGVVKQHGPYEKSAHADTVAKGLHNLYGFPITRVTSRVSYWVATGTQHPMGRGQFEIIANSYLEAVAIAEAAKFGDCPVTSRRFNSFPVLGVL